MYMFRNEKESGVTAGILIWMSAAIMLVVMLPVLAAVLSATPVIESGPLNATQQAVNSMVASSYGLIIVVLIILAAVIILGVIAYLNAGSPQ
jgi:hypothetical protein